MRKIFVIALAALLLLAGCSVPGDIAEPIHMTAAPDVTPTPPAPPPRSYNGIAEGDVLLCQRQGKRARPSCDK